MNVLSVETSTRTAGVALIKNSSLRIERLLNHGQPSGGLIGLIDSILKECKKTINDVGLFVVDTGPGSFTGIRVGLSTVSGLSYALSKPAVGVSSFEVIAHSLSSDLPVVVWIDTHQGDVYQAILRYGRDGLEYISLPKTGRPEELLKEMKYKKDKKDNGGGLIFVGDGANKFRDLIIDLIGGESIFLECSFSVPSAGVLGMVGLKKFLEKGINSILPSPFYLRDFSIDKKLTEKFFGFKI